MAKRKFKSLRELFRNKRRWCKGAYARDMFNTGLDGPANDEAVSFCLLGGIGKVYGTVYDATVRQKLRRAAKKLFPKRYYSTYEDLAQFNDNSKTTIKDIRRLVKEANV